MVQVLVAEDMGAISLELEEFLTAAGFSVAGPFSAGRVALEWLDRNEPDVALLDAFLSDGLCIELAQALRLRTIPFLFLSGGLPHYGLPDDIRGVGWIAKPFRENDVVAALTALSQGRATPAGLPDVHHAHPAIGEGKPVVALSAHASPWGACVQPQISFPTVSCT
jgi:DNA-binding response OmpR family regulator